MTAGAGRAAGATLLSLLLGACSSTEMARVVGIGPARNEFKASPCLRTTAWPADPAALRAAGAGPVGGGDLRAAGSGPVGGGDLRAAADAGDPCRPVPQLAPPSAGEWRDMWGT
jgi:hypothetical protein